MDEYELRPSDEKLVLTGGALTESLRYPASDPEAAIRVVGFLSQRNGSTLRIFDATGAVTQTQRREATVVLPGAVGGLSGPR